MAKTNTKTLTIRLTPELLQQLRDKAEADRRSLNTTVLIILEDATR